MFGGRIFRQPESCCDSPRSRKNGIWHDKSLEDLGDTYGNFGCAFSELFSAGNYSVVKAVRQYLCGLMQAEKRNMERMAEAVPDSDDQVLQKFLEQSSWGYRAVMDRVAKNADELLGGKVCTRPYIGEAAFQKKRKHLVGVARQCNGCLRKPENCQVGVFGALGRGDRVSLSDAQLYLPKKWTGAPRRCERADVPRAEQIHRTRLHSAQEIIRRARQSAVRFE